MLETNSNEPVACDPDSIFASLSQKQYLRPHRPLHDVLAEIGLCPMALQHTVIWLELDTTRSIGRLRASELMQLSRCVHRIWQQSQPATSLGVPTT